MRNSTFGKKTGRWPGRKAELGIFGDFWEGGGESAKGGKMFFWKITMVIL